MATTKTIAVPYETRKVGKYIFVEAVLFNRHFTLSKSAQEALEKSKAFDKESKTVKIPLDFLVFSDSVEKNGKTYTNFRICAPKSPAESGDELPF